MTDKSKFAVLLACTIIGFTSQTYADDCVFSLHGTCYNCDTPYNLKVGTMENCEKKCPNRVYVFKDRTCRLKVGENKPFPASEDTSVDMKNCEIKEGESTKANDDTVENYFKGHNGKCYKCSTKEAVKVNKESCDKERFCHTNCKDRISKHYNSIENKYSVYKCPSNRPLMDRFMMCWSCSEPTPIDLSFDTPFNNKYCDNLRYREKITQDGILPIQYAPYSYLKK